MSLSDWTASVLRPTAPLVRWSAWRWIGTPIIWVAMTRRLSRSSSTRKGLRETVKLLNLLAAPSDGRVVKVRVVRNLPTDRLGDCSQGKDHYLIRLDAAIIDEQPDAVWLLLAHEWGHALAWENCTHSHGEAWGMALARAWRIISGELSPGDLSSDMD